MKTFFKNQPKNVVALIKSDAKLKTIMNLIIKFNEAVNKEQSANNYRQEEKAIEKQYDIAEKIEDKVSSQAAMKRFCTQNELCFVYFNDLKK